MPSRPDVTALRGALLVPGTVVIYERVPLTRPRNRWERREVAPNAWPAERERFR